MAIRRCFFAQRAAILRTGIDIEHCYVRLKAIMLGDLKLEPGDYQCAMAATTHITSHTEQGCMVLIVASQQNQILPWTR